ncbi:N-acetylneuraminate synthase family protein [Chloroflexota bacterium]
MDMNSKNIPFIIAEIGINHIGDINFAKQLIDMAKNAGCDAVKFQKRTPEICVPEHQKGRILETPWGVMTYLEYRYKVEFGKEEYDIIDDYCRERRIDWFASAWDIESQVFLKQYDLKYNKIASPMLTNTPLLEAVAEEGKHTFISTGMSTYEDIDRAVDIFRKNSCPFTLLHCVSNYPIPDEECNLLVIKELQERYNCPVGYSGHEVGVLPPVIATVLGAVAIERHITLDRAMWGSDQAASLEKRGLELVTRDTKLIAAILGDGIKRVTPEEKTVAEKLRYFRESESIE